MLSTQNSVVLLAISSNLSFIVLPVSSSLIYSYRAKAVIAAHVAIKPVCAIMNSDNPPTSIDVNPIARFIILLCVVCYAA
ncbi:MAG: hypothetical protein ABOJ95_000373 [Wolbachia endosymbiont of Armadillidium vulgare]|nr:hypothetical protein [Wolbachia endosymbiont of Armadillidium vulgare]